MELIVPVAADMCMIDAIRDGRIVRAAVRVPGRPTPSRSRGRIRAAHALGANPVHRRGAGLDADPAFPRPHGPRGRAPDRSWTPTDLGFLQSLGLRSWIVATMSRAGRSLGTLTMITAWSGRAYSADDVRFAQMPRDPHGPGARQRGPVLGPGERGATPGCGHVDARRGGDRPRSHAELVYRTMPRRAGWASPAPRRRLATPQPELLQRVRVWTENGARLDVGEIASQLGGRHQAWRGIVRIDCDGRGERWAAVTWAPIDAPDGRTALRGHEGRGRDRAEALGVRSTASGPDG